MTVRPKVTVPLDEHLIPRAKALARRRGLSLSALIERAFTEQGSVGDRAFSERWRGPFRLADLGDERYPSLAQKYL